MKLRFSSAVITLVVLGFLSCPAEARRNSKAEDNTIPTFTQIFVAPKPPAIADMPGGEFGSLVKEGYRIFENTPKYATRYSGNGLSCENCHIGAGTKPDAIPMWGSVGMYPQYEGRSHQVITLQYRVQECFVASLHGFVPPVDSRVILALDAYLHWISKNAPIGVSLPGARLPVLPDTGYQADPIHGKQVFAEHCAACHGNDGQGLKKKDGGYIFPPLWGSDSFSHGAGMARPHIAARFIWANMPFGRGKTLTPKEAEDVAAWVDMQWREPNPRKGLLGWIQ